MEVIDISEYTCVAAVIAAWLVGEIIKKITDNKQVHKFIPLICAIVGIIVNVAIDVPMGVFSVYTIIIGAVSGWAATGIYEMFTKSYYTSKE